MCSVSAIAVAKSGLVAVLEEKARKLYIYNHSKELISQFTAHCDSEIEGEQYQLCSVQMIFDNVHNLLIANEYQRNILRYNLNGNKLPTIAIPAKESFLSGVTMVTNGDMYIAFSFPSSIMKYSKEGADWEHFFSCNDLPCVGDNVFDPKDLVFGQLAAGSDGFIYIAARHCIVVLDPVSKSLVRWIGIRETQKGVIRRIKSIFVSGDGYVFVSDYPRCSVHILRTDGSYVNMIDGRRFGDKEIFIHPAAVAVVFMDLF